MFWVFFYLFDPCTRLIPCSHPKHNPSLQDGGSIRPIGILGGHPERALAFLTVGSFGSRYAFFGVGSFVFKLIAPKTCLVFGNGIVEFSHMVLVYLVYRAQ